MPSSTPTVKVVVEPDSNSNMHVLARPKDEIEFHGDGSKKAVFATVTPFVPGGLGPDEVPFGKSGTPAPQPEVRTVQYTSKKSFPFEVKETGGGGQTLGQGQIDIEP